MRIPCDYLLEFATVAREGTFPKAAAKLGISHSSLRQHMKSLETSLGMPLLDRSTDGVSLTDAGNLIYNGAADIEEILDRITFEAQSLHNPARISVYGISDCPPLTKMLDTATRGIEWEGRQITIENLPTSHSKEMGEVLRDARKSGDSVLYILPEPPNLEVFVNDISRIARTRIVSSPLFNSPLVALVDSTHPFASRSSIMLQDLSGQTIVHASSGYGGSWRWWLSLRNYLRTHGIDFRSANFSLATESDWLVDFGPDVLILPSSHRAVVNIESTGKACVPIADATQPFYAFWCESDKLAELVGSVKLG